MGQVRIQWVEAWAAPGETTKSTTFRLVMTDTEGLEYTLERALTDAAGGTSWEWVVDFRDSDELASNMAVAGISPNVFAAMFGVLFNKRR